MDSPCPYPELRACLRSIATINRLTFAHRPTLFWLDAHLGTLPPRPQPLHLVDVGCGYGDLLRTIAGWAHSRRIPLRLTGVDLNPDAIRAAQEATSSPAAPGTPITFVTGDALALSFPQPPDVIVSSLLTHHLPAAAIVRFLRWQQSTARLGWFINDLHRQPIPYHAFRLLARLTTWHRFTKHDGPVSILRSFRPADWQSLCQEAGLGPALAAGTCRIDAYRPARLCVSSWHSPTPTPSQDQA